VAPANAAWYYDHSVLGDPITIVGSPVKGTWGDGWTIWFLSWRKLVAGSATHQMVVADSRGSQLAPAQVTLPSSLRLPAPPDPAGWRQAPHGGPRAPAAAAGRAGGYPRAAVSARRTGSPPPRRSPSWRSR